ncbi:hypothetical protein ADM98_01465 [Exiguobacterium sp. BMC-KP]|uniref:hypothetical protein n=1 Tax=Exiguobacterium sp. BMC-KP TaxID=1684312 RepID=UPI0006AA10C0|nr:hypothetical protein [Exiguobacterium sp. BMC-KP]KOP31526.1 hypothetical protein ADM98_01465 [Exiguobacterium sp. BMC-KP]
MYDIDQLYEKVEYERWILDKISNLFSQQIDDGPQLVKFNTIDEGTFNHFLRVSDSLLTHYKIDTYIELSPLLFVNSFKTIDMIVEWILESNNVVINSQSTYLYKIKEFKKILNKKNSALPLEVQNKSVYLILITLYENLRIYRNKVIHASWGKNVQGNLNFEKTKGCLKNQILQFNTIINLAKLLTTLLSIFVEKENKGFMINNLKYLSDKVFELHKIQKFHITTPPVYYKVECTLNSKDDVIDLVKIFDHLSVSTLNRPFSFSLILLYKDQEKFFSSDTINKLINEKVEFLTLN